MWRLFRIGVIFFFVFLRIIIFLLINVSGIKFFIMKIGSLKNKNMFINYESRIFVVL